MKEKIYKITLTESQLRLLSEHSERSARVIAGQLEYGIRDILLEALNKSGNRNENTIKLIDDVLHFLKGICWNLPSHSAYGVGYDKESDTLWDMYEVIRHQLWRDSEDRVEYTNSSYPASHWNKEVPLIEVELVK